MNSTMDDMNILKEYKFTFHGRADEYFTIWIINIFFTIITLGVYSAWAKVRTRRYFYGNTQLNDAVFDFTADPIKILIGRLIAMVLFFCLSYVSYLPEYWQIIAFLLTALSMPCIIIKALRFNFYHTSYQNIRSHFNTSYLNACYVYLLLPLLIILTVGLAYPYFLQQQKKLIINHSSYGTTPFAMHVELLSFYKIFFSAFFIVLLLIVGLVALIGLYPEIFTWQFDAFDLNKLLAFAVSNVLLILLIIIYLFVYFFTQINNLVISHTRLNGYQFSCCLQPSMMFWIYCSNAVAIAASFGLLIPWAKIRSTRYKFSCISISGTGSLDEFIKKEAEKTDAIGEEIGDLFDLDIGL